jgi:hypothetical protein
MLTVATQTTSYLQVTICRENEEEFYKSLLGFSVFFDHFPLEVNKTHVVNETTKTILQSRHLDFDYHHSQ